MTYTQWPQCPQRLLSHYFQTWGTSVHNEKNRRSKRKKKKVDAACRTTRGLAERKKEGVTSNRHGVTDRRGARCLAHHRGGALAV